MRYLILDVETTTRNKGHPFTNENKLCYTGYKYLRSAEVTCLSHLVDGPCVDRLQSVIDDVDYLVAFNAKFDCHWLERHGINLNRIRIWDVQYAEFLFSAQRTKYPSLEGSAVRYGLGHKIDKIKTEYWDKGIDTPDIPKQEMEEYLEQDVLLTEKIFLIQYELFHSTEASKWRLFQLHMEDQCVLREMEKNGILYEKERSLQLANDVTVQIASVENELQKYVGSCPINWDSGDHLSAFLYGGTISVDTRVPVGVYKTGAKTGQPRYKIVTHTYQLERQFEPIKGSELKKEGFFSTDEPTLKQLKGTASAKKRLSLIDQRSKLEKLRGTYYSGYPKKIDEMGWTDNIMHPSLNQCVAVTGRLSSSNPNGQNQPEESKRLCISRYV